MHRLRCILATFFAILIAIPACCCASVVRDHAPAKHSCCEGGKKEKRESVCNCDAKTPRTVEKAPAPPHAPVVILPEPAPAAPLMVAAVTLPEVTALPEEIDTGPPRWRLAMLQRFLI